MPDRVNELLAAASAAGRSTPPPPDELAAFGHAPVPPALRCQACGRRLALQEGADAHLDRRAGRPVDMRFVHDPDGEP